MACFLFRPGTISSSRKSTSRSRATGISTIQLQAIPAEARSDADYIAEFRHELEEAVRIRLRADVPVGVYLSGGLDSCAVLGLAARHHPDPIQAFTLTFDDVAYDEGPIAREMAALAGAKFHTIPINQDTLAENFADAILQSESFCVNAHGVAKFLLSKAVRDAGYKVVITGEGSDEILGGYAHFRRDMLLYNREGQDPAEIEQLLKWLNENNTVSRGLLLPDGDVGNLDAVRRILGYVPSWFETFSSRAVKARPLLAEDFSCRFKHRESYLQLLSDIDVPRSVEGPRRAEPVALSLGEVGAGRTTSSPCWATGWRWGIRSRAGCPSSIITWSSASAGSR